MKQMLLCVCLNTVKGPRGQKKTTNYDLSTSNDQKPQRQS